LAERIELHRTAREPVTQESEIQRADLMS
jgi:hypothetical protein